MATSHQVDAQISIGCGRPSWGKDPGGGRSALQAEAQTAGVGDLLLQIQNRALSRLVITGPGEGRRGAVNHGTTDRGVLDGFAPEIFKPAGAELGGAIEPFVFPALLEVWNGKPGEDANDHDDNHELGH